MARCVKGAEERLRLGRCAYLRHQRHANGLHLRFAPCLPVLYSQAAQARAALAAAAAAAADMAEARAETERTAREGAALALAMSARAAFS